MNYIPLDPSHHRLFIISWLQYPDSWLLCHSALWLPNNLDFVLACPTLCHPMEYSPPGSSVHGILQARILKWVSISFSRVSSPSRVWNHIPCICCIGRGISLPVLSPGKPIQPSLILFNLSPVFFRLWLVIFVFDLVILEKCSISSLTPYSDHNILSHIPKIFSEVWW